MWTKYSVVLLYLVIQGPEATRKHKICLWLVYFPMKGMPGARLSPGTSLALEPPRSPAGPPHSSPNPSHSSEGKEASRSPLCWDRSRALSLLPLDTQEWLDSASLSGSSGNPPQRSHKQEAPCSGVVSWAPEHSTELQGLKAGAHLVGPLRPFHSSGTAGTEGILRPLPRDGRSDLHVLPTAALPTAPCGPATVLPCDLSDR